MHSITPTINLTMHTADAPKRYGRERGRRCGKQSMTPTVNVTVHTTTEAHRVGIAEGNGDIRRVSLAMRPDA